MNDKFLHITNSLNDQYPPADIPEDIAWAEMRKLLDEDNDTVLPPPPPPMPPNGNGYWKYGLLLLLILVTGIAVYVNRNKSESVQAARHEENTAEEKVTEQNKNIAQSLNDNDSLEKYNSNNPVDTLVINGQKNKTAPTDQLIEKNISPVDKNNSAPASEDLTSKNNNHATRSHTKVKTSGGDIDENNNETAATEMTGKNKPTINPKKITGKGIVVNSSATKSKKTQTVNNNDQNITERTITIDDEKNESPTNPTATNTNSATVLQDSLTVKNADTLKKQLANTNKSEKNKTDTTPVLNDKKNKKIALAAGLGLNQFFTVGGQQHSNYNSSGTVGAISDYIPVPFIRAYFNKKLYLQIEAQFNTPQYTKQLLAQTETIYDTTGPVPVTYQNSTYINKLFYFNIPLSIHYSPCNNFYVGAGLQFSQLKNGVGLFETKLYNSTGTDSISKIEYASLNTDSVRNSVYNEIKTTEWRVLVDANYQWKNLVFGIRYNQALSNFINVQISSTEVTQARNSSLQLYLRYILWKNKPAKALFPK